MRQRVMGGVDASSVEDRQVAGGEMLVRAAGGRERVGGDCDWAERDP